VLINFLYLIENCWNFLGELVTIWGLGKVQG